MSQQLRQLALFKQGLSDQPHFENGVSGTYKAIEHLGYVQIDTLSVIERAHHHTLWNRVPDYDPAHLNQLISEQQIFEYWYHAASYLPIKDYRYAMPRMLAIRNNENRYYNSIDKNLMNEIIARVQADGPVTSRDLDQDKTSLGKLWKSTPTRHALDKLFMQGDLMICARNGMEKIYNLTERCLPTNIDLSMPTIKEYATYLFNTTLRSHGVFTLKQLLHLKTNKLLQKTMCDVLNEQIEAGIIKALIKEKSPPTYVDVKSLEQISASKGRLKILSPFDNAVIHRERLNSLFKFDYRIECYVTASKRTFGYFCLPILFGDEFVGRVDCKAHRTSKRFEIIQLHLGNDSLDRELFLPRLKIELQKLADFNKCPMVDQIEHKYKSIIRY